MVLDILKSSAVFLSAIVSEPLAAYLAWLFHIEPLKAIFLILPGANLIAFLYSLGYLRLETRKKGKLFHRINDRIWKIINWLNQGPFKFLVIPLIVLLLVAPIPLPIIPLVLFWIGIAALWALKINKYWLYAIIFASVSAKVVVSVIGIHAIDAAWEIILKALGF